MGLFKTQRGFTLIELMIAVAIVAIIAAIAYPNYMQYVYQSRRQGAVAAMYKIQLAQERYRANATTYGTLDDLKASNVLPVSISGGNGNYETDAGYYNLSVTGASATGYTITATATAQGSQTGDSGCTTMTMDQNGNKSPADCFGH